VEQFPVLSFTLLFAARPRVAERACAIAITRLVTLRFRSRIFFLRPTGFLLDLFHHPRQHASSII
jgi:hypothetical protein